ncbi:class I SAM-dependent DNA methyltransferase [Bacillus velezensis]|uniref:HsdM family class I SAM-dependent methyltransferase n=1 Tax=Bacillus TaxID=1386 RepID=UPI000F5A7077|nr:MULTISPECIES: N-6 DNA methylase [Bacillus]AZJ43545.1 SAM-dependent methyltransferase [Bacillus velezensis]MCR4371478.1 SAM-dependent methyltransferase [Bacillus amyloliquefaciens]
MAKRKISETETEWLFKDLLQEKGYFDNEDIIVEFKDATANEKIKKLLSNASKKGTRQGIPDFILRSYRYPDIIFLVECKADTKFHSSVTREKYADYAVDGVLLYSSFVSKEFDVLSIALSGSEDNYEVSAFWQLKGTDEVQEVKSENLLTYDNYLRLILESDDAFHRDYSKLLTYAKSLNSNLHKKKIKESYRALLISGILVALQNDAFRISYNTHKTANALISSLLGAISVELRADPKKDKNTDVVLGAFDFIKTNKTFSDSKKGLMALTEVITSIKDNVYTFLDKYKYIDTLSQFYIEFLRYANTDKGLGIVLTPMHIAQLFAKMANVRRDTTVLDNAAGTGGFLVASLGEMMIDAGDDETKIEEIREKQVYGIEYESSNLALLVSNMIIHSDGRSNIIWGDTFDVVPIKLKGKKLIDVGLLNPPFKMDKDDVYEFEFIFSNLDAVKEKGTVIALVPASVVTDTSGANYEYKKRLLKNHTLEAVVSLPEELFANSKTSVVTVGIVITAHVPHSKYKETWFGYWRNDGFVKTKKYGRADVNRQWDGEKGLERQWLNAFTNRKEIAEFSINKIVTPEDEWIAEAYLETDYSSLDMRAFEKTVRKYQAFKMENGL